MKHNEDNMQAACVRYFRLQYPQRIIFAIPNAARRSPQSGARLKKQGMLAGVADLCIPEPWGGFHGAFIEMKFGKNRTTSDQEYFLDRMQDRGYWTSVCYSITDFIETVRAYFATKEAVCR